VLAAIGLGLLTRVPAEARVLVDVLPGFVLAAAGIGAAFVAATTTAMARVDHQHAGLASGILNTAHELGASLGIAVVSAVAGPSLTGSGLAGHTPTPVAGFDHAFTATAIAAAVLAVAAPLLLPSGRPASGDGPVFVH